MKALYQCAKIAQGLQHSIRPLFALCLLCFYLKELRNCILCIIRVWSLFCSVRVYMSLHFLSLHYISLYFLPILLVKLGFRFSVF